MIRLKNLGEPDLFMLSIPGSAQVANDGTSIGSDNVIVPFSGYLKEYWASFTVNGVDGTGAPTQNVVVDILQNNVSIFTATNANKINWLHTALARTPTTYGVLTTDPVPIVAGDQISVRILQILNGTTPTQPVGLNVAMNFTRRVSPLAATRTGDFGLDLD